MKEYRQRYSMKTRRLQAMVEELLDNLPAWNEVLDLMMETEDGGMITVAATKRKRD